MFKQFAGRIIALRIPVNKLSLLKWQKALRILLTKILPLLKSDLVVRINCPKKNPALLPLSKSKTRRRR
jgi:hypothetical protein